MSASQPIPIRRLTLYKHGVGFVERAGDFAGEALRLLFRADEVNDALKSLLVLDRGGGGVRAISYDTPADRAERLANSPIALSDDHALLDLLGALRGHEVRLTLVSGTERRGRLVGVDVPPEGQPLAATRLAVLEPGGAVRVHTLAELQAVLPIEATVAEDLRFFLDLSRARETHRAVTIQLSPGEHDLAVSYLLPSPTWRVTYRLVAETASAEDKTASTSASGQLLLQGWGVFDNRLEEDLEDVVISLVAGQPISFVYDLAASRIPPRPVVADAARVAAAPVEIEEAWATAAAPADRPIPAFVRRTAMMAAAPAAPEPRSLRAGLREQAEAVPAAATAELGELFAYETAAPVSVKRGQSALVPILHADLPYRRLLLFNARKLRDHPVAALQFRNATGLVLERGPVTVLEDDAYHGEAVMPFTRDGGDVSLAFAVELGIAVTVIPSEQRETAGLRIRDGFLYLQQAVVRRTNYHLESRLPAAQVVTVEHPVDQQMELVSAPPEARTADWYRWDVRCSARDSVDFRVEQRRYEWQTQNVLDQSYQQLAEYLGHRWLDQATFDRLRGILDEHAAIGRNAAQRQQFDAERDALYAQEEQLRQNMAALAKEGEEGELRRQVVARLRAAEDRLEALRAAEAALDADTARRRAAIEEALRGLTFEHAAG